MTRALIEIFLGVVVAVMGGAIFQTIGGLALFQIIAGAALVILGAFRLKREESHRAK